MKNYIDENGVEILPFYPTPYKLVKSGCLIEIYQFGKDILINRRLGKIRKMEENLPKAEVDKEASLKSSARRAKRMIKRLIYTNSFNWFKAKGEAYLPITITLTFRENIQDLKRANNEFTKFIKRLNYETNRIEGKELKQSNLKYLAVFELQQRGAIHYHCIFFNLPYINRVYDRLKDIWRNGMVNIGGTKKGLNKIKNQIKLKKLTDYFIKYIQKSIFENSFPNQKKYITSKGLIKPRQQYFEEVIKLIKDKLPIKALVFKHDGEQDYYDGKAEDNFLKWFNYWQYDLANFPSLNKSIDDIMNEYS